MESKKELKWYKGNGHHSNNPENTIISNLTKTTLMQSIINYRLDENINSGTSLHLNNETFYILTDNFEVLSKYIKNMAFEESEEPTGDMELLADVSHKI